MKNGYFAEHFLDGKGLPAGGVSSGRGFTVSWQNGPLGRGNDRKEPNGAFVEDVISACRDRIEWYQKTFPCDENEEAFAFLGHALSALNSRTARREAEGVEGTHQGS